MPDSKRGRSPLTLRLTVFFDCRFRPRSYLLELTLDLLPYYTLLALTISLDADESLQPPAGVRGFDTHHEVMVIP
ncbi:hypothetical protein Hanom_Chr16g01459891 [Helianthus anomalus]